MTSDTDTSHAKDSPRTLFRNSDFLKVWGIGAFGGSMRWLELLAIGLFAYDLTASPFVVALMVVIRFSPMFLIGAIGGVIAERVDRKLLLVGAFTVMTISDLSVGLLALGGQVALWHVMILAFVNGCCWSTDFPVRRTMLGEIVGGDLVGRAMAFDSASNNATRMIGPLIGGVVYGAVGLHGAFLIASSIYALCVFAALATRYRKSATARKQLPFFESLREGFAYARKSPAVMGTLAVTAAMNMFGFPYSAMIPVIGKDELELGPSLVGLLMSAEGGGALIGALLIATFSRSEYFARIYLWGSLIFVAGVVVLSFMPSFVPALTVLFIAGLGVAGFSTMQSTIMFLVAPPEMRSRIMGVLALCIGTSPLGMLHIGWLADLVGVRYALAIMGVEGLAAIILSAIIWPQIRK